MSIDRLTEVPVDLFADLMKAGKQARDRGQHRLVKKRGGGSHLSLSVEKVNDRELSAAKSRRPVLSEAGLRIQARAVGEHKNMLPPPRRKVPRSSSASGSGFAAVSALRRPRTSSTQSYR